MGWLVLLLCTPTSTRAQAAPEVVRGVITDTRQQPVVGATVTITGDRSQALRTTRTDEEGRYQAFFLESDPSYTVLVRKIGFSPALRRATTSGSLGRVMADIVIAPTAFPLEPIIVRAPRLQSPRKGERPSIGGLTQEAIDGTTFLLDPSNLDALAGLLPGLWSLGEGGYSALGASPDQNGVLLDGMTFSGGALPPDAACGVAVVTTTSDPARGQFAGAQTSVTSCHGSGFIQGAFRVSFADPMLTWGDPASAIIPSQIGSASGYLSGPLGRGAGHYRLSYFGFQQGTKTPSLMAPRESLLPELGLSPDTIDATRRILRQLDAPLTVPGAPVDAQSRRMSVFLNADWNLGESTTLFLTASGAWSRADALGVSQQAFPTVGNGNKVGSGQVMIRGSTYFRGLIDQFSIAVAGATLKTDPYLQLAGGNVSVGTEYPGGEQGLTSLRFGGGFGGGQSSSSSWELLNRISSLAERGAHQVSTGQQLRFATYASSQNADSHGTYTYQSLSELRVNHPSSYSRTLNSSEELGQITSAALWMSDIWRASRAVSVEGGLRLDHTGLGIAPVYNPLIDTLYGKRTDRLPSAFGLSPRVGFAWLIKPRTSGTLRNPVTGRSMAVEFVDLADLTGTARGNFGAGVTFFGNLGAYRGVISEERAALVAAQTGLAGTTRVLSCVGGATPIPDWGSEDGDSFSSCQSGVTLPVLSDRSPSVTVFDPSYGPPMSWRANLGLTGVRAGEWEFAASAVVSVDVRNESSVNVNLDRTAGFTLPSEGHRPVFASISEIVPTSGILAPGAARISHSFGTVNNLLSDLHATASQVNVSIWTPRIVKRVPLRIDYSYNHQWRQQRGFDGFTGGDPFAIETVRGAQPLHQVVVSANAARLGWLVTSLRLNVQSGAFFSPSVVGDINGDGRFNDRAFVPDPATISDPEFAQAMSGLLAAASPAAQRCLHDQFGRVAGANSCRGPTQVRVDLALEISRPPVQGETRFHATVRLLNAGASLLRLFGASSAISQGSPPPDGRLLQVTGFDPSTREFRYGVNQRFGQPIGSGAGGHNFPPFQIQVGAEYRLGGPSTRENLHRLGLFPDGPSAQSPVEVRRAIDRLVRNPIDTLLALSDSLLLSTEQETQLRGIASQYLTHADSVLAPLLRFVEQQGIALDDAMLSPRLREAVMALLPYRDEARRAALEALSEAQRQKLQAIMEAGRSR